MSQINRLVLILFMIPALLIGCERLNSLDDTNKDGDIFSDDAKNSSASIDEYLKSNRRFGIFTDFLMMADLDDTLDIQGPFTVFAPTDAAFDRLPIRAQRILRRDRDIRREVLLHHVVESEFSLLELQDQVRLRPLNGRRLRVFVSNGETFVGPAKIMQNNGFVRNGVIHVIDEVLIPRRLQPTLGL